MGVWRGKHANTVTSDLVTESLILSYLLSGKKKRKAENNSLLTSISLNQNEARLLKNKHMVKSWLVPLQHLVLPPHSTARSFRACPRLEPGLNNQYPPLGCSCVSAMLFGYDSFALYSEVLSWQPHTLSPALLQASQMEGRGQQQKALLQLLELRCAVYSTGALAFPGSALVRRLRLRDAAGPGTLTRSSTSTAPCNGHATHTAQRKPLASGFKSC